jgi:hypothetical protein
VLQEEFEDTKEVIRINKSVEQTPQWQKEKGQKDKRTNNIYNPYT